MCLRICILICIFHSKQTLFEFTHSIFIMWLYRKFARHSLITHTYRAVIHNRNVHVNKLCITAPCWNNLRAHRKKARTKTTKLKEAKHALWFSEKKPFKFTRQNDADFFETSNAINAVFSAIVFKSIKTKSFKACNQYNLFRVLNSEWMCCWELNAPHFVIVHHCVF